MEKNPGTIYKTNDGQFAIGYNKEQAPAYSKYNRVFLRYYEDEECEKPKMIDGKKVIGVKLVTELTVIGFVD